ncbi:hypothetical protein ACJ5NV_03370 [Loktanella agnita]|uniref:hypothetical protein n=1 Tax=Loktanella agnita TaxID=287097 RepID=UPI0039883B1A
MSDSLFGVIRRNLLPKASDIEAVLKDEGFVVELAPNWKPLTENGFLPIEVDDREAGCEVFFWTEEDDDAEDPEDFSIKRLQQCGFPQCDLGFELAFSSEDEWKSATLLGFALATLGSGSVEGNDLNGEVIHGKERLRRWLHSEFEDTTDADAVAVDPSEVETEVLLSQLLRTVIGTSVKGLDHDTLRPKVENAAMAGFGYAPWASSLKLEFSNGVTIGGPVWTMRNNDGLQLEATHKSRYKKRPDKMKKQIIAERRRAGHENPDRFSRHDPMLLDNQALSQAVATIKGFDETVKVSDVSFAAPNWVRVYFAGREKMGPSGPYTETAVLGFISNIDRAEVHVQGKERAFSLNQYCVTLAEDAR